MVFTNKELNHYFRTVLIFLGKKVLMPYIFTDLAIYSWRGSPGDRIM